MAPRILPVSALRRKTGGLLDDIQDEEKEVYVTRYGHPIAVLVDCEHYERLKGRSRLSQRVSPTEPEDDRVHPREGVQYPTVANPASSLKTWLDPISEGYEGAAVADTGALYDEV